MIFCIVLCIVNKQSTTLDQLNTHAFSWLSVVDWYELLPQCYSFHLEWLQNTKVICLFHYL